MESIKNRTFILLLVFSFLFFPKAGSAHSLSAAFTNLTLSGDQTELQFSIDTLSVIEGVGGDQNDDGTLNEQELKGIQHRLQEWIEDSLVLEVDGKEQTAKTAKLILEKKGDKDVVTAQFTYPAIAVGKTVKILDGIFYQGRNNSSYNNFLTVSYDGQVSEAVLQGKNREWTMLLAESQQQQQDGSSNTAVHKPAQASSWQSFLLLGMKHILTGYDHLLFLLALLIGRQTIKQYIMTVTAFTIAHSITLSLAVFGIVDLPSKLVESVIALSICYVAAENIFRKKITNRWMVTFIFGLIHGLGFASILTEMNLPKADLVIALLNFNVGIELIQLLIVLLLLPILFKMQSLKEYKRYVPIGSAVIFLLGAIWFIQRLLA